MNKILFVSYGAGHIKMLIPLIKELRGRAGYQCEVLGLTTAQKVLTEEGIEYFGYSLLVETIRRAEREMVLYWGRKLLTKNAHPTVSEDESIAYLGINYLDLIETHGEERAAEIYSIQGRQGFSPLKTMEKLVHTSQPQLVVTTNSPRSERAALLAAKKLHVPSLCLSYLFATDESREFLCQPGAVSKVCVLTDEVKRSLQKEGAPENQIVVTGNPAFDVLADPSLKDKASTLRQHLGWEKSKVVLWAAPAPAGGYLDLAARIESTLTKFVLNHKDWALIVRLHPSDTRTLSSGSNQIRISTQTDDLPALLTCSDLVVTLASTVGMEALLLEKPLITVLAEAFADSVPYAKLGLSTEAKKPEELPDMMKEFLEKGRRKKPAIAPAGSATRKVLEVIEQLLRGRG